MMTLEDIKSGEDCVIVKVHGYGEFRHRVMELGFVRGQIVRTIKNAPMKDPVEYQIMDSRITLRRSEAAMIEVITLVDYKTLEDNTSFAGTHKMALSSVASSDRLPNTIEIALVGNPNCGKTTLFNKLTGLNAKTGNYAGVTVGIKSHTIQYGGYNIVIVDLPGTYSVNEYTNEEIFVREYLTENHPDIVLNVVDATNLERNLFLTTQLIDMSANILMSLNMFDELEESGSILDYELLSQLLGFPIVPTVAKLNIGIENLLNTAIMLFEEKAEVRHFHINYGNIIENEISNIEQYLDLNSDIRVKYHTRYLSIKLIENPNFVDVSNINDDGDFSVDTLNEMVQSAHHKLEREYKDEPRATITAARYGFVRGALAETQKKNKNSRLETASKIDKILTNRYLGIPALLLFIWIMFQATFTLGAYPAEWLEMGVAWIGGILSNIIPEGMIHDLVVDGIVAGVGGVLVFLPNILILFLFMSFMEESGYLARAAFIMDKLMHKLGLHGKSFIPLLMGFGCNVPAIVATRVLASRKDRLITMLAIPFMSCSARLPVYILFISIFFAEKQGLVLLLLYTLGVVVAVVVSKALNRFIKIEEEAPYVMELPTYRIPTLRTVSLQAWDKGVHYIKKMGTTIFAFSVVIWALGYFPRHEELNLTTNEQLEQSYIGYIGKAIEPVIRPLGFDWKMGVSLMSAIGAKEVAVSTISVLYSGSASDEEVSSTVKQNITNDIYVSGDRKGEKVYTPVVAFSYLVFMLLYIPCVAVVAAIAREGGRKWAVISVFITIAAAWVGAFLTKIIGNTIF